MRGACARCGTERGGDERWCRACGLDFTPQAASLPTPEAFAAAERERTYFEAHPELAAAERTRRQAAEVERQRQERVRSSKVRPPGFADYRDVSWRARLARGWLIVVAALTVMTGALEVSHLNLLAGKSTADLDLDLAQRIDDSNATLGTAYLITLCAYLFSAAFFVAWTFRAYKNTTALGAQRPRFRAGWAIGGWFVPIVGLYRPKEIINDIWRGSDPDDPPVARKWRGRAVPRLLDVWWALYLIGAIADRIAARLPSDTLEHDRTATGWGFASSVFTVIGAFLAFAVVTRLTRRQRERAAVLQELPVSAPPDFTGSQPTAATAPGS